MPSSASGGHSHSISGSVFGESGHSLRRLPPCHTDAEPLDSRLREFRPAPPAPRAVHQFSHQQRPHRPVHKHHLLQVSVHIVLLHGREEVSRSGRDVWLRLLRISHVVIVLKAPKPVRFLIGPNGPITTDHKKYGRG